MKLAEREREFTVLTSMFDDCRAGHGGVAMVRGAAASGKTALLRAFGARVVASDALFLQATASSAERDLPLGVLGQLLLGVDLPAADTEFVKRLLDSIAITRSTRQVGDTQPPEAVKNALPRLWAILTELARTRPVVLSIDDVNQADQYSLECVLYLARRLEVTRILLVLGESSSFLTEDSYFRSELLHLPNCRQLRLGLLTCQGVAEVIAGGREWRRARSLASAYHKVSGGSPLLTRALVEDSVAAAEAAPGDPVPGYAFRQAVGTCLYHSDSEVRQTARTLAVLGSDGSRAEIAEVLGVTPEAVGRSMVALEEMGLLSGGRFRDGEVRSAVLQNMRPGCRADLEGCVARVLHDHGAPAAVLARHLVAAKRVDAPWALPALLEAAERALADDEVAFALECLRTARDIGTSEAEALAIKAALVRAQWRVDPAATVRHLPELVAAAILGRLEIGDTLTLLGCLLWFGHAEQALDVLAALEKGHTEPEAKERQALDLIRLWTVYGYPGLPERLRYGTVNDRPEHPTPAQSSQRRAMMLLSAVLTQGPDDDVVVRAEQILQGTRLNSCALIMIMIALISLVAADRLDKAAFWCDQLIKEAVERRDPVCQAMFASIKALVYIRLGRLTGAEESARSGLVLVSREGWGPAIAVPLAALIYAGAASGKLDEAATYLAIPVPESAFDTPAGLLYLWARGYYHLADGRPYAALDDFHACGDLMGEWDLDLPALVPWRTDAAQVYLSLGDRRLAQDLTEEQLGRGGAERSWIRGVSLRVLAATCEPARRVRLLGDAVAILRESDHRFELALAIEELGRAHRELGDERRERTLVREAQRLRREGGAHRHCLGIPPADTATPRPPELRRSYGIRHRTANLSDAELRVATLAASGHTNRQIAGKLYITVSTVEQHLTRVYRKLDVRRRADLGPRLGLDVAS